MGSKTCLQESVQRKVSQKFKVCVYELSLCTYFNSYVYRKVLGSGISHKMELSRIELKYLEQSSVLGAMHMKK